MPTPLIIGHRGASAAAPENTMAAFRLALEANADGVEFDVRLTKDAVPVVIHDDTLRRTGGVNQRIAELTLAQLKENDVGSWFAKDDFRGERVPTLFELFELFAPTSAVLYLEMKSEPAQREELARTCCEALAQASLKDHVVVECFDLAAIELVKSIDSSIRTAALFEPTLRNTPLAGSATKMIDKALAVGADEIALHHKLANARAIEMAQTANLSVVVWTVDDPSWISRARANGIKALITNNPALMVERRETLSGGLSNGSVD
jgi:glycerophosphoryl diester phosphodiesterase